jgi:hypothetical protein
MTNLRYVLVLQVLGIYHVVLYLVNIFDPLGYAGNVLPNVDRETRVLDDTFQPDWPQIDAHSSYPLRDAEVPDMRTLFRKGGYRDLSFKITSSFAL